MEDDASSFDFLDFEPLRKHIKNHPNLLQICQYRLANVSLEAIENILSSSLKNVTTYILADSNLTQAFNQALLNYYRL